MAQNQTYSAEHRGSPLPRFLGFLSALSLLGALGFVACSADDTGGDRAYDLPSADNSAGIAVGAGGGSGFITSPDGLGGAGFEDLPEEIEDETSYRAPVATGRYLWSANPESGRVALIDVVDLSVQVLAAGLFPTYLAPVPSADDVAQALVLNVGSSDATRFIVGGGSAETARVEKQSVRTHVGANAWSIADSGKWAVAWSQAEPGDNLDPTEGLQEITVIKVEDKKLTPTRLTVGYRPSQVMVSDDDSTLLVVSAEGITLVDLSSTPEQYAWINLGFDEENRSVSLSDDGAHALVRRTGKSTVDLIDMKKPDDVITLDFPGAVTDVDLAETGRAVAVIRDRSELSTFTLQEVLQDPTAIDSVVIPSQLFGSAELTSDGKTVVLYTTAVANDRVNIVDLSEGDSFLEHRFVSTQAPIYAIATSPDGAHAAVLSGDSSGRASDAFAVVALRSERFPRIVGTAAPVDQVALGNDFGIITAASKITNTYEAHLVSLPSLSVQSSGISTQPLSTGVISLTEPDVQLAYAAQRHPEGRVTFFDFQADEARTLTGYELSAEVVDE